jgi:diadenosine tetraphosphatase ApaH/serine/threonine PP2A family protein phosphatase
MYGFYEETQKKYGSTAVWKAFNETFDCLPLAAVVNSTPAIT